MAQMHTLHALPLPLDASLDPAHLWVVFASPGDDPELADEDDEEDDEDDDEDEDEEDEDEEDDEEDEDDDDEDEDDEDEEDDEVEDEAEARTARGQLKRQNGHRRGGIFNG